jgi:hypothetical protein
VRQHQRFSNLLVALFLGSTLSLPAWAQSGNPAAAAQISQDAPVQETKLGYDRGFFVKSGDGQHAFKLNGRLQTRVSVESEDGEAQTTGFAIPRARLKLKGSFFDKRLKTSFQGDFSKARVGLKDLYVDGEIIPKTLVVRVGQFKKPYTRMQIGSTGAMAFLERTPIDAFFGAGRDIGVVAHNNYKKSPGFEYAAGAYIGSTLTLPAYLGGELYDDTGAFRTHEQSLAEIQEGIGPVFTGRVGMSTGGIDGYNETDFAGGPLRVAVAANGLFDAGLRDGGVANAKGGVDAIAKAHHFSVNGAAFLATDEQGEAFNPIPEAAGAYLQTGYLILGWVQPALRMGRILSSVEGDGLSEYMVGVNVYVFEDRLKWQTDGGAIVYDLPGQPTTSLIRSQIQGIF